MIANNNIPTTRSTFYSNGLTVANLLNSVFPNGVARLQGVYGIRFKTVFTIQVSATPFHQGVLAASFQYQCTSLAETSQFVRASDPCTATNLPHVRLDIAQTTSVQLVVPYVNINEFSIIGGSNELVGLFALSAILPVNAIAGAQSATYQVFIHLEDLDLIGAKPEAVALATVQAGKLVEKESEQEAYPFSTGLHTISKGLSFIAKGVPSLSSIAGPPAWAIGKAAGAIRYFGYAKPQIQDPPMRMHNLNSALEHNVDEPSPTIVVGPQACNHLAVTPSFAFTDIDEMALPYVLGQYAQICVGAVTTGDTTGTIVYATNVSPSSFWFRAGGAGTSGNKQPPQFSTATTNAFQPSHLFYFASMFQLWRGGVKFRFTFAKTKMHAGRYMVAFNPNFSSQIYSDALTQGVTVSGSSTAGLVQPFGYSAIFDLKDSNVFEFEVPYTASIPHSKFLEFIGGLSLTCMEPLIASTVTAPTCPFLVEVKGMSDFELSIPRGVVYPSAVNGVIRTQSGKIIPATTSPVAHTVGESINSVKQLIMLPKWGNFSTIPGVQYDATAGYTPKNQLTNFLSASVLPWFFQRRVSAAVPAGTTFTAETFNLAGNIANCYLFAKGSTDVHAYMISNTNQANLTLIGRYAPGVSGLLNNTALPQLLPSTSTLISVLNSTQSYVHLKFPAYQSVARYNTNYFDNITYSFCLSATPTTANATFASNTLATSLPQIIAVWGGPNVATVALARAAGDDAALGHYMGPTPLALLSGTAAPIYDPDYPFAGSLITPP